MSVGSTAPVPRSLSGRWAAFLPALVALPLASACDKPAQQPAPEAPAEPGTDAAAPPSEQPDPAAEEKSWSDKSFDEKKQFMGTVYFPAMKKEFQAHDGEEFAKFTCATCHGDNASEVGFELPNDLTPLDAADPIKAGQDMDAEITTFMMEVVVPKTAEMFEKPMWSPDTPEGVGCFTCHSQG